MKIYRTDIEIGKKIAIQLKGCIFYQIHDKYYRIRPIGELENEELLKKFGNKLVLEK